MTYNVFGGTLILTQSISGKVYVLLLKSCVKSHAKNPYAFADISAKVTRGLLFMFTLYTHKT